MHFRDRCFVQLFCVSLTAVLAMAGCRHDTSEPPKTTAATQPRIVKPIHVAGDFHSPPNLVPPATQPYCENGFTPIFNGKDIDDWVYGTAHNDMKQGVGYQVNADEQIVYCTVKDGGNLYTKKEYANFILRFEYKLTENANNGIGIRAPLAGDAAYVGMEIQVLDDYGPDYKHLRPVQYCGSVYDVFAAETGFLKPVGLWNSEEIMADGMHVRIVLNDHVINDVMLDTMTNPAVLKRHPGLFNKSGHIGFLGHGAEVQFRNLRIKELPDTPMPSP